MASTWHPLGINSISEYKKLLIKFKSRFSHLQLRYDYDYKSK
ncbi:hypothetical protein AM1_G0165 (plasmid) [Acaryochloris marina MBIC11017]|uniref:Uncharacterized protein n=1 Tax=Acaryochloris marina (strain MBIC 11017) TaxID=329726 RepID=A8ZQQ9_ACAM1|nr:hypothetical protein AM1_G0165 [Acaryochloris marina MBIC11017]